MRVGVIGSRDIGDFSVQKIISHLPANCSTVVSGNARGIDRIAKQAAEILNCEYKEFLPDYEKFGKSAPLVRNLSIVRESDMVIAFWDMRSRGTAHAINLCIENNVPFKIIPIE